MKSKKKSKSPELAKKMTTDMRWKVAELTGYTYSYVNKVLNPNNKRINRRIISASEQLVCAKEIAIKEVATKFKMEQI